MLIDSLWNNIENPNDNEQKQDTVQEFVCLM